MQSNTITQFRQYLSDPNSSQQKAAALLQEQSIFMKGLTVDLDDETKRKLAQCGMENAFEDWTQTWKPDQQQQQKQQQQQNTRSEKIHSTSDMNETLIACCFRVSIGGRANSVGVNACTISFLARYNLR